MNYSTYISEIITILKYTYPEAICSLTYTDPFQLLVAVRLSAQCTDARVNLVTPQLFAKYPDAASMAKADLSDVESLIKSCGFYHTKAKDIIEMSQQILYDFQGIVPDNIDALTSLSGVGRKTANLIVGDVYNQPSYVCDTHCIRITNLLGITHSNNPYKVEMELRSIIPPEESRDFCHRLVLFGREYCIARRPQCGSCPLNKLCPSRNV